VKGDCDDIETLLFMTRSFSFRVDEQDQSKSVPIPQNCQKPLVRGDRGTISQPRVGGKSHVMVGNIRHPRCAEPFKLGMEAQE
jgi:hypothetical protein